jgi:choloylglycine hydrolase
VPKKYRWKNVVNGKEVQNSYSFIGIGQELEGVLSFFDGVNEHGFAAAALYFAGYAQYDTVMKNAPTLQVAAYDLLHYILSHCTSVDDLRTQINRISLVGIPDPMTQTAAPLHWIAADRSGKCVILEQTGKKIELFANPIGVMVNSPDFLWHMTNLRNYMEVTPRQIEETVWGGVRLSPFGQAGGTVPLPGGYTSPERFVRATYLKTHIPKPETSEAAIFSFFQIMKSVSIPKGAVVTDRGTDDYTQYTAFIDINSGEYFFNTYENLQIKTVRLYGLETSSAALVDLGKILQPMTFEKL